MGEKYGFRVGDGSQLGKTGYFTCKLYIFGPKGDSSFRNCIFFKVFYKNTIKTYVLDLMYQIFQLFPFKSFSMKY